MLTVSASCGPWEANCYLVGADDRDDCVLVDVGMDAVPEVERLLASHGRRPVAVFATHGHLDHVADAAAVADAYGIPVHIHPADRHLLSDPGAGLGPGGAELVEAYYGTRSFPEPAHVREWEDNTYHEYAGLTFLVLNAPGHTPGSMLVHATEGVDDDGTNRLFTGDVIFAGSIGRTDLPGGSPDDMVATLRTIILTLPYDLALFPGHGPATSVSQELFSNPYLLAALKGGS